MGVADLLYVPVQNYRVSLPVTEWPTLVCQVYCPGAAAVPVTTSTSGVYSHTCVGLQEDSMHSVRVAGVNGAGEGEVATATGRTACTGLTPVVRNVGTDIVVMVTTACSNQ